MSQLIAKLSGSGKKIRTREELLALVPEKTYEDGRTKQCHADECDINKIMARFDRTGTMSHLAKYEGVYADFSDFNFHEQINRLTQGREIFDALPAELRQEFGQSPSKFFAYVNDPANAKDLAKKLPALAEPGRQLTKVVAATADEEAASAAASERASEKPISTAESAEKGSGDATDA